MYFSFLGWMIIYTCIYIYTYIRIENQWPFQEPQLEAKNQALPNASVRPAALVSRMTVIQKCKKAKDVPNGLDGLISS